MLPCVSPPRSREVDALTKSSPVAVLCVSIPVSVFCVVFHVSVLMAAVGGENSPVCSETKSRINIRISRINYDVYCKICG